MTATATSKKAVGLDHVYTGPDKFLGGRIFSLFNPFTWNCAILQFCLPFKNLRGSDGAVEMKGGRIRFCPDRCKRGLKLAKQTLSRASRFFV